MASNVVTVKLTDERTIALTTDTPDISALVNAIVELRSVIDCDKIDIQCENDTFDKRSFKEVISATVKKLIQDLELDKDAFETAMLSLKNSEQAPDATISGETA